MMGLVYEVYSGAPTNKFIHSEQNLKASRGGEKFNGGLGGWIKGSRDRLSQAPQCMRLPTKLSWGWAVICSSFLSKGRFWVAGERWA